jgi:serine O-acetyltransferase
MLFANDAKALARTGGRMVQHLELVEGTATPPVWAALRNEAQHIARVEPSLASILNAVILRHDRLGDALSYQLARRSASA